MQIIRKFGIINLICGIILTTCFYAYVKFEIGSMDCGNTAACLVGQIGAVAATIGALAFVIGGFLGIELLRYLFIFWFFISLGLYLTRMTKAVWELIKSLFLKR